MRVQKDLKANENGKAVYDFSYQTAVMVTEKKSPRGEKAMDVAVANGLVIEGEKGPTYDEVLIVDPETPITREEYEKEQ